MKPADIKILLEEGEGTTLEFKESLSGSFTRELVALANTLGPVKGPVEGPVETQSGQVLVALSQGERSASESAGVIGLKSKTGALKRMLGVLLSSRFIRYAVPEKPSSRLQRYRLTRRVTEYLKKTVEAK